VIFFDSPLQPAYNAFSYRKNYVGLFPEFPINSFSVLKRIIHAVKLRAPSFADDDKSESLIAAQLNTAKTYNILRADFL
jgi:hypothetical protein